MWYLSLLLFVLLTASAHASEIKPDETVVFFPTTGTLDSDGTHWLLPIHGWIFEPERDSIWRAKVIEEIQEHFEVEPRSPEGLRCARRASLFLVDNESRKKLAILLAGRTHVLERSSGDGHFHATVRLEADVVRTHAERGVLPFEAVTREGDGRRFRGQVLLPPTEGVSVISDIDDTIKVSDVLDRRALLRHTFLLPFEAVSGMPSAYAAWAAQGATLHYVSSSPWQLYEPLEAFRSKHGFPAGAFHLRSFRLSGSSIMSIFKSPMETKPPRIRAILSRYPKHAFLLVGDSGEKDPEVYGLMAREHPEQIRHIFIRRVDGADNSAARFDTAFAGVPREAWTVFDDPAALRPGAAGRRD